MVVTAALPVLGTGPSESARSATGGRWRRRPQRPPGLSESDSDAWTDSASLTRTRGQATSVWTPTRSRRDDLLRLAYMPCQSRWETLGEAQAIANPLQSFDGID